VKPLTACAAQIDAVADKAFGKKIGGGASKGMVVGLNCRGVSAEIIESCRRGDRYAFQVIYETYKDKVYSIALYFFHGDASTASDVTQQVFLKLISDFRQFKGDAAFSTWLYRLVSNVCIDETRRRRWRFVPIDEPVEEQNEDAFLKYDSQEDAISRLQVAGFVQRAVSALPPKFRFAILLRYFEDLSYEEMAKVLNCSLGTVASRLSRGHRLLAGKLAPFKGSLEKKES
jgi:RNA polymerase sigma-70 factor (ECF subfamily)